MMPVPEVCKISGGLILKGLWIRLESCISIREGEYVVDVMFGDISEYCFLLLFIHCGGFLASSLSHVFKGDIHTPVVNRVHENNNSDNRGMASSADLNCRSDKVRH